MLVAIRLFLAATGLVVLALAVTARGLVPDPDVRTRIGEVPTVGRPLVQQAIVPPAMIERQSPGLEGNRAEAPMDAADARAPAAAHSASGGEPSSGPETAAAPREADLVAVNLTETPSPAKPSDIAYAALATEQVPDRAAAMPGQAAPSDSLAATSAETLEPLPVAAPAGAASASAPDAKHDAAAASVSAGPPALAFAAEPAAERKPHAGERPGAAAEKAKPDEVAALADDHSPAIGPASAAASEAVQTRSSKSASTTKSTKKRKIARSSARKAAEKSEPRGKIKVARRASRRPGKQPAIEQWTAPDGFPATPQTYQYRYTAPTGESAAPADTTSVQ